MILKDSQLQSKFGLNINNKLSIIDTKNDWALFKVTKTNNHFNRKNKIKIFLETKQIKLTRMHENKVGGKLFWLVTNWKCF